MDLQCGDHCAAIGPPVGFGEFAYGGRASFCGNFQNGNSRNWSRINNAMKQSSKRLVSVLFSFLFVVAAFVCFFDLVQPAYSSVEALRSQQLGEANSLGARRRS